MNKNIFIYWNTGFEDAPFIVKFCLNLWERLKCDYTLHKIDDHNINDYLDMKYIKEAYQFHKLTIQAQSDIIRLELLYRYGGIWTDATILPLKKINDWLLVNHHNENYFYSHITPGFICSSFIASNQSSYIVKRWLQEIQKLIDSNGKSVPVSFSTKIKHDYFRTFKVNSDLKVGSTNLEYFFMVRVFTWLKTKDTVFNQMLKSNYSSWSCNGFSADINDTNFMKGFDLMNDFQLNGYNSLNKIITQKLIDIINITPLQKLNWRAFQNVHEIKKDTSWFYINNHIT